MACVGCMLSCLTPPRPPLQFQQEHELPKLRGELAELEARAAEAGKEAQEATQVCRCRGPN